MDCLECEVNFPLYPLKCERVLLPGGIKGFILAACGTEFDDITDLDEWCLKKNTGLIVTTAMRRILGSSPEAEEALAKLGSCDPDELLGFRHSLDILDYNSEDPSVGFKQDDFYNWLNRNYTKLMVGFITCDDRFYGFVPAFSVVAKRLIEGSVFDGKTFYHSVFKWDDVSHLTPVLIPGLGDTLENCAPALNAFRTGTNVYGAGGPSNPTAGASQNSCVPNAVHGQWLDFSRLNPTDGAATIQFVGTSKLAYAVETLVGGGFKIRAFHRDGTTNDEETILFSPVITEAVWHHIAIKKTGMTFKLFIDGVLSDTQTLVTNTTDPVLTNLTVSYGYGSIIAIAHGAAIDHEFGFDDIIFYEILLSDAQVSALASGIFAAGARYLYRFAPTLTTPSRAEENGGLFFLIANPPTVAEDCFTIRP